MKSPALLLVFLNLLYIGLLPRIFFRKDGHFNARWWVTAAPFLVCAGYLVMDALGMTGIPAATDASLGALLELVAMASSTASIALISFTLGTHRAPLSLWHQENDMPSSIVTYGAYRRIRHPFYAAFLLALLAASLLSPHVATLGALVCGFIALNATAAREERRLLDSPFGKAYADYMRMTGRFWPAWRTHGT